MTDFDIKLGEIFARLRQEHNYSQQYVADSMKGVYKSTPWSIFFYFFAIKKDLPKKDRSIKLSHLANRGTEIAIDGA